MPVGYEHTKAPAPHLYIGIKQHLKTHTQVSEMHGELMELNQQLVTKNLVREKQLHDMEKKLAEIEAKV